MTEPAATGGYDEGYRKCPCFWGKQPGSFVARLPQHWPDFAGARVLDAGCGEGKNAIFLAKMGAQVLALDVSPHALANAHATGECLDGIEFREASVPEADFSSRQFDVVVMYGFLHCLPDGKSVARTVSHLQAVTARPGLHVVCAFNSRSQDLEHAHPEFRPFLAPHEFYLGLYRGWTILDESDEDLTEIHPHNGIRHTHSMTRFIARTPCLAP